MSGDMTMEHVKWPHIGQLHDAVFFLRSPPAVGIPPTIVYRSKAKLHGTNAAVQVHPDGRIGVQSRSKMITPQDDNQGFAAWVHERMAGWSALRRYRTMVIFGEWAGPGVQKGTSCNAVTAKFFAVFAAQVGDSVIVEPAVLRAMLAGMPVHILPWHSNAMLCPADPPQADAFAAYVAQSTSIFADTDPWVSETFGIAGPGEGLVWYPDVPAIRGTYWSEMLFKSKQPGFDHAAKSARVARATPPPFDGADDLVARYVTPMRCQQAIAEGCDGVWTMQTIGPFLRWISQDICRESATELAAAGVEWKAVAK